MATTNIYETGARRLSCYFYVRKLFREIAGFSECRWRSFKIGVKAEKRHRRTAPNYDSL